MLCSFPTFPESVFGASCPVSPIMRLDTVDIVSEIVHDYKSLEV